LVTVLVVASLLNAGCMTQKLWKERWYHPADPPQLDLHSDPDRPMILVAYRERFEKTDRVRRRIFWLDLKDNYDPAQRPLFVDPADYPGLSLVPMLSEAQGINGVPATGYAAMETRKPAGFDLWKDGDFVGRYQLPSYEADAPTTPGRVATTPVALLVDGVIITVVAALIVGVVYLSLSANSD